MNLLEGWPPPLTDDHNPTPASLLRHSFNSQTWKFAGLNPYPGRQTPPRLTTLHAMINHLATCSRLLHRTLSRVVNPVLSFHSRPPTEECACLFMRVEHATARQLLRTYLFRLGIAGLA